LSAIFSASADGNCRTTSPVSPAITFTTISPDDSSIEIVVKVIAGDTGEVVRQLPSAEALKIADSLHNAHSL
ncbi:flagellar protein FlaG, partial [Pseudomonas quasicaspiana]|nr:flagellar protein FlaG [Pseudomonas quasicaspiana]